MDLKMAGVAWIGASGVSDVAGTGRAEEFRTTVRVDVAREGKRGRRRV